MNGKVLMLIFTVWKTLRLDIERRDVLDQFLEKIGKVIARKLLVRKKVEKVRQLMLKSSQTVKSG